MKCYLVAFTTPTTEQPASHFTEENVFDINNLPKGFKILYCQEFEDKRQCKPRILRLTRLLCKIKGSEAEEELPKGLTSFSEGREFTERKIMSWKLDDSIGNCFHDAMDEDERIKGGNRNRSTGAVFKDVYFYMTCVEKRKTDLKYLFKDKVQRLFDAYFNYIKRQGLMGSNELYKWRIVQDFKNKPNLESDNFIEEIKE